MKFLRFELDDHDYSTTEILKENFTLRNEVVHVKANKDFENNLSFTVIKGVMYDQPFDNYKMERMDYKVKT